MTLLEVTLALSLTSALFVASGFWLQETASTKARTVPILRFEASASALLERIQDAILVADATDPRKPRIQVAGSELAITTRLAGPDGGPVVLRFRFEASRAAIVLRTEPTVGAPREETCLGRVLVWKTELDPKKAILSIEMQSKDGVVLRRRLSLP
jgi:hypothetical protein